MTGIEILQFGIAGGFFILILIAAIIIYAGLKLSLAGRAMRDLQNSDNICYVILNFIRALDQFLI